MQFRNDVARLQAMAAAAAAAKREWQVVSGGRRRRPGMGRSGATGFVSCCASDIH